MNQALYLFLDLVTGVVISIMVVCNTLFGQATTMGVSLIVNHLIGLTILSLILLLGRGQETINGPSKKVPWYLKFNGLFGLAILNLNYITIVHTGASLAMASTVFGQSLCSLLFDLTGWMGMKKRRLNKIKTISLSVCAIGIGIMARGGTGNFPLLYVLLGMLAGVLTMTQMVLNSTLALYEGPIRASHRNFIGGLVAGILFYFLFQREATITGIHAVPHVPFLLIIGGGTLSVFVVVCTSYVVVKIPAIYSALLLSSAQILMSLLIDTLFFDTFSLPLLIGACLLLLGMAGNLAADKTPKS
ncbi:MAG: DMT family transporter [Sphaerochaetaceae bacterium]